MMVLLVPKEEGEMMIVMMKMMHPHPPKKMTLML
jgi:hypothetical protein